MIISDLTCAVVEDQPEVRRALELAMKGAAVTWFEDSSSLVAFLEGKEAPLWNFILLDLCSPRDPEGQATLAYIPRIRQLAPQADILVQSGISDVQVMRAAVRAGAWQFLLKEHLATELPAILERWSELRGLARELDQNLLGESLLMRQFKKELLHVLLEVGDVLIEGETGTGKEACAQAFRKSGGWVAVNCSAIPSDLFESEFFGAEKGAFTGASSGRAGYLEAARAGVLFLDEIQSLSLAHQAKLLRVLETRKFQRVGSQLERSLEARVVCAANESLEQAVREGRFREDLYYRLSTLSLRIPPLRVRSDDIPLLARHFLEKENQQRHLTRLWTDEGLEELQRGYDWPGNVRELRNAVRKLVVQSAHPKLGREEVQALWKAGEAALGWEDRSPVAAAEERAAFSPDWESGWDACVSGFEKFYMEQMLKRHSGPRAREKMKLGRSRYYEKLKMYGLKQFKDY